MIETEQRYEATKRRMAEFENALAHVEDRAAERDPLFQQVLRKNIEGELQTMYEQLAEYEERHQGRSLPAMLTDGVDLPTALIRARIAAGLRQADLAARLGISEAQIRRYEAAHYAGVGPEQIRLIGGALGFAEVSPTSGAGDGGGKRPPPTA
jgi:ribosome-binding protein aMBF1 (putative translation factor)